MNTIENISLEDYGHGQQGFVIREQEEKLAEMVMTVSGNKMTVHHTEVFPQAAGKGLGKALFTEMVTYARHHHLKVIPLCTFVQAQLKRHPESYADIT